MALRTETEITPGIVKRDASALPPDVLARFAYGLVDWRPVHLTQAVSSARPENARAARTRRTSPARSPQTERMQPTMRIRRRGSQISCRDLLDLTG